jgi:hypothetical protein
MLIDETVSKIASITEIGGGKWLEPQPKQKTYVTLDQIH